VFALADDGGRAGVREPSDPNGPSGRRSAPVELSTKFAALAPGGDWSTWLYPLPVTRSDGRVRRRLRAANPWRAAAEVLGTIVVAGVLLASPFIYLATRADDEPTHRPLTAVPVSARACPEVQAIQAAANSFENAWYAADASAAPWTVSRTKLERALEGLDRKITAAVPVVPASVGSRLTTVQTNLRVGKAVVVNSTDFSDVVRHGYAQLNAVYAAYGDAATLVGDACGSLYVYTGVRGSPFDNLARGLTDRLSGCESEASSCPTTTTAGPSTP
jgi:hypothetical protein